MIYDLRVYTANPGRMNDLHSRFINTSVGLFKKHGIKMVGFWVPEGKEEEQLVYILAFEDVDHMNRAWESFLEDPEWKAAFAESEKDGPLESNIQNTIMRPTSYSPVQ